MGRKRRNRYKKLMRDNAHYHAYVGEKQKKKSYGFSITNDNISIYEDIIEGSFGSRPWQEK